MSKEGGFGELISNILEAFMLLIPFGNLTTFLDRFSAMDPQENMYEEVVVVTSLAEESGYAYVNYEGERWKCFSFDILKFGDNVVVTDVRGLLLHVEKMD